jgi:glycerate dehydrogenase
MKRKFKKLVILDKIILSNEQWAQLRALANEVVEHAGLTQKQVVEKLAREQDSDPGAVCFTALAMEEVTIHELNERLAGADAVITCWTNIPDGVLRKNPQIKYIGFWTNLVNHRINLSLAEKMGIQVTYIPDYGTVAVAEYVFSLLHEMNRRVAKQAKDVERGTWSYELLKTALYVPSMDAIPYHTLHGKTLGIIGFGRIGQCVAKIAEGYGMNVLYYSLHRKEEKENAHIRYADMEEVLRVSDIVSLHISPYANVDQEGHISIDDNFTKCAKVYDKPVIGREELSMIKDGAIFVNTSAGRLVDEDAMFDEAESGRIRVAADVYRSNPDKKRIKQIIAKHGAGEHMFTLRGGWLTYESVLLKGDMLISQLENHLQGGTNE